MQKETRGRPLKFQDINELNKKIEEYFKGTGWVKKEVYDKKKQEVVEVLFYEPATVTGLAVALDTSRETLINYERGNQSSIDDATKELFFDAIKKAKDKCEHTLEYGALVNQLNPTMAIFSAKNNFSWRDKSEMEIATTNLWDKLSDELKPENNDSKPKEGKDIPDTIQDIGQKQEGSPIQAEPSPKQIQPEQKQ